MSTMIGHFWRKTFGLRILPRSRTPLEAVMHLKMGHQQIFRADCQGSLRLNRVTTCTVYQSVRLLSRASPSEKYTRVISW